MKLFLLYLNEHFFFRHLAHTRHRSTVVRLYLVPFSRLRLDTNNALFVFFEHSNNAHFDHSL